MQSVSATLTAGRLETKRADASTTRQGTQYVGMRCSACGASLPSVTYHALGQVHDALECRACPEVMPQERGIWRALGKSRQKYFQRFIEEYETVRRAEGRGSADPEFYRSLPFRDWTGRFSEQWEIRARTYQYIERKLLLANSGKNSEPLRILDLGAGNGWLSYRLASLGHRPIAVDLQTNLFDGLGAAVHYEDALPTLFPRFQAELDRLPFGDDQFDFAIFNASFHYSENYDMTLGEAIRCLRPGGTVVIADSPTYSREECGQEMLAERRREFQKRFGFSSASLASREYLTGDILTGLEARHDVRWETHGVWYGLRWACRPVVARLKRRREPSKFLIYTARVKEP